MFTFTATQEKVLLLWIAIVLLLSLIWVLYKEIIRLRNQSTDLRRRLVNAEGFCMLVNKVLLFATYDDLIALIGENTDKKPSPKDVLAHISNLYRLDDINEDEVLLPRQSKQEIKDGGVV